MIRKFLIRLCQVTLPLGLLVTIVNYSIDPANIFSTNRYVKGIADILSAGHNVDNISNYDERLLQEQMIVQLKETADIVVLGSSRVMQVGADFFPGKKVINCGVSHANIRDVIAIVALLDSMKKTPPEILLNVDPGLVSDGYTNEWESLDVYYHFFAARYLNSRNSTHPVIGFAWKKKLSTLFSVQYFQSAILFSGKGRSKNYTDVGHQLPALYGRMADGTVAYAYDYMHPDTAVTANDAAEKGKQTGIGAMDASQQQLLDLLADYCSSKGIRLQLCMLPYHPSFYNAVNQYHHQAFKNYNTYYTSFAERKKINITGSFDPLVYRISGSSFYDESHSSKESLKSILIQ